VLLSIKAGLRAVEIAHLTWGCIREDDTVIELIRTKGDKGRTVPINKDLRKALLCRCGASSSLSPCRIRQGGTPALASNWEPLTRLGTPRPCALLVRGVLSNRPVEDPASGVVDELCA
jgi:integrase